MGILAALCCWRACCRALVIDGLAPVAQALTGARMPTQIGLDWLTIVPVAQSRSSYNGLLVFLFIAASAWMTAGRCIASPRTRCAVALPGIAAFPTQPGDAIHRRQLRPADPPRVRHAGIPRPRDGDDAAPGDMAPAQIVKTIHDPVWDTVYAPIVAGVTRAADMLNHLQFLTIRRYLGFVFAALVLLLLALALWQ